MAGAALKNLCRMPARRPSASPFHVPCEKYSTITYASGGSKEETSRQDDRQDRNPEKPIPPKLGVVEIHPPNSGGESSKNPCFTVLSGEHSLNLGGETRSQGRPGLKFSSEIENFKRTTEIESFKRD